MKALGERIERDLGTILWGQDRLAEVTLSTQEWRAIIALLTAEPVAWLYEWPPEGGNEPQRYVQTKRMPRSPARTTETPLIRKPE